MQQPIDNKYERFESLPQPVQRRLFELMAAWSGADALYVTPEPPEAPREQLTEASELEAKVSDLAQEREKRELQFDAVSARQRVQDALQRSA